MKLQDFNVEMIAKVAHEVNRVYCASIGDMSQPSWDDAPEWQKKSAYNGVIFHLKNPGKSPKDSHDNFVAEKIAEGWIYGPVKDVEKKQHPCICQYEELPKEQQIKDSLFIAVVHSF